MKMKNKIILVILIVFGTSIHSTYARQCAPMNLGTVDYSTTSNSVGLTWLITDLNVSTYTIAYGTNGFDPNISNGFSTDQSGNSLLVGGLTSGTTYSFWFKSNCSSGSSAWVGPLNITPTAINVLCDTPLGFANTNVTTDSASFTWTSLPSTSTYEIKYGPLGFNVNTSLTTLVQNVSSGDVITGLAPNKAYDFYIRSVCDGGEYSNWSSLVSITTLGGVTSPIKSGSKYYVGSYKPELDKKYVISAWVKEVETGMSQPPTYTNSEIAINTVTIDEIAVTNPVEIGVFQPTGRIIDGWQRIEGVFTLTVPIEDLINEKGIQIQLRNTSTGTVNVFFDDIRVFPFHGNMKSFVYDNATKKLMAELDENNYATYYEYDNEGGLIRVKKETTKGIYTIQETRSSNAKKN